MLNSDHKIRTKSLLSAISGIPVAQSTQSPLDVHLIIVGSFNLSHQSHLETFAKSKQCSISTFRDLTELLQVLYQCPHIPYLTGVIATLVADGEDISESVSLLKFLRTAHPDAILRSVFFGSVSSVDSALYLSEQSDGYKPLTSSSEKDVVKFLDAALDAAIDKRARLIENLCLIAKASALTPKEIDVMLKVISGLSNKEIALGLNNSSRTVEIHRASIFEKLNVKNAIELSQLMHGAMRR